MIRSAMKTNYATALALSACAVTITTLVALSRAPISAIISAIGCALLAAQCLLWARDDRALIRKLTS